MLPYMEFVHIIVKYFEMERFTWIICVGPKCNNHKCSHQRKILLHRGEGSVVLEAETEVVHLGDGERGHRPGKRGPLEAENGKARVLGWILLKEPALPTP